MENRLCINCKFYYPSTYPYQPIHGCIKKPNPVTGEPYGIFNSAGNATDQRSYSIVAAVLFNKCGKSGRWFEPK